MLSGQEPWTLEYPGIDKPNTIDHGPKNGFNCSASLGMIYQAIGVHSAVINGRKQIDYIDHDEMVCKDLKVPRAFQNFCCCCTSTVISSLSLFNV